MSNLSDIGFPVSSEQDVNEIIMKVVESVEVIKCPRGFYYRFSDASGAEIYLQGNQVQELIGFNPHFAGKSRRLVSLTKEIERDSSELDGGFHAWANPSSDAGDYPFVFDVPDFRTITNRQFPRNCEIQLTAFASNDFRIFENEKDYYDSQNQEPKYASKSFVPTGLFAFGQENETTDLSVVRPIGMFAGEIKEFELRTNNLTNEKFYAFLVETLGGEIDVAADTKLIPAEPKIGGIVSGQFWLSGRLNETPL